MRNITRILFVLLCVFVTGCAVKSATSGVKISDVRIPPAGLDRITFALKRSVYARALESSRGPSNMRIVPMVVSASQAPVSPEYRIFNIRKGSVGEVLGLKNSDILVAAHEYVIQNPSQFYAYLSEVQKEKSSTIEIRRGDRPMILVFDFIDG